MKTKSDILFALILTAAIFIVGYASFGIIPSLLFFAGYITGFVFWVSASSTSPFASVKVIYWVTFLLFIVHRVEEKLSGFFKVLSHMTGIPTPEIYSFPILLLLIISMGAWLVGPYLSSRGYVFGNYLVWTFFASMGITELAHFVFPFFTNRPYGYFPGIWSVMVLAPVAWYGMYRFVNSNKRMQS